jgi:hypothetical protein
MKPRWRLGTDERAVKLVCDLSGTTWMEVASDVCEERERTTFKYVNALIACDPGSTVRGERRGITGAGREEGLDLGRLAFDIVRSVVAVEVGLGVHVRTIELAKILGHGGRHGLFAFLPARDRAETAVRKVRGKREISPVDAASCAARRVRDERGRAARGVAAGVEPGRRRLILLLLDYVEACALIVQYLCESRDEDRRMVVAREEPLDELACGRFRTVARVLSVDDGAVCLWHSCAVEGVPWMLSRVWTSSSWSTSKGTGGPAAELESALFGAAPNTTHLLSFQLSSAPLCPPPRRWPSRFPGP